MSTYKIHVSAALIKCKVVNNSIKKTIIQLARPWNAPRLVLQYTYKFGLNLAETQFDSSGELTILVLPNPKYVHSVVRKFIKRYMKQIQVL